MIKSANEKQTQMKLTTTSRSTSAAKSSAAHYYDTV